MADKTGIEWTEATWNPIVGCSIVSAGCTNCYAMKMAHRISAMQATGLKAQGHISPYIGTTKTVNGKPVWTGTVAFNDKALTVPLSWKRPRKIFVNSMSDLFHEAVPDEWIDRVFAVMALCPQHTFQVLTKRSKRMREYCSNIQKHGRWLGMEQVALDLGRDPRGLDNDGFDWLANKQFLPNVLLGVSCEDQRAADERIPDLLATPAAVRGISAEPLLGAINLRRIRIAPDHHTIIDALDGYSLTENSSWSATGCKITKLNWIIVGGESGPGHRPMQIEWAESIRQQCEAAGTAFFFKQDSGARSGQRGRASDALWACKQFPEVK